ncbi:MAG TPA: tetratricopeptide repeat protein, partial [Pirellulales bacterium]|nr:tetratricopeptide repeat protein [Pirellulales bacterium]
MKRRWGRALLLSALLLGALIAARPLWVGAALFVDLDQARRALAASDLERALAWLQAAQERQRDNAEVQFLLARVYRRTTRYHPAKEHLERAAALGWPKKDLQRQQMMMLFQMGNVQEAEPYLTALLETGLDDELAEEVYEVLVTGYLAEYRVQDVEVCLEHWLAWQPQSIPARIWRANLLQSLRRRDEFQAALRDILSIDPTRVNERLALAHELIQDTRVDEALAELEACRSAAPDDGRVLLAMGLCHYKQGAVDHAQHELEEAVSKGLDARNEAEARIQLGQIALDSAEYELAIGHFERAIELTPEAPVAPYGLGTALSRLGDVERGKKYLRRSQELQDLDARLQDIGR